MRVKTAITAALALSVVGGGCSRPWQASTADLAPLSSPPYGEARYSNYSIRLHSTRRVNGLRHQTHRALCRNRNRRLRGREHARSRRSPFRPRAPTNSSRDPISANDTKQTFGSTYSRSAFDPKRTFLQSSLHKNTETQISFVGRVGERATDYQSPSGVTSVCPKVQFNIFDSQGSWRGHPRISHGATPSYDGDARSRVTPPPSS